MIKKAYYLDNAATSRISEAALKEMVDVYTNNWGNPSSFHLPGREAKNAFEYYTNMIAECLGVESDELYITSGGTESNNWAIKGAARMMKRVKGRKTILCSKVEHPSVINSCESLKSEGFNVQYIEVTSMGNIDMDHFRSLITNDLALVCVMRANNETGTIETNVQEIGNLTHLFGGLYMCDAVQAVGKIDHGQIKEYNADFVSFSAHKFHGPKGIGGLYIRNNIQIDNLIDGGGQQENRRSGTHPVAMLAGMAIALKEAIDNQDAVNSLKDKFEMHFSTQLNYCVKPKCQYIINGGYGVPGILNIGFKGIDGDMLHVALDDAGIFVSNGSACHSGDTSPSHVLLAMNVPEDYINGVIRISVGDDVNSDSDVDYIIDKLCECIDNIHRMQDEKII